MIWLCAAIGVLLLLYALFFWENRRFKTTFTVCKHPKVQTPFRVVQVSDLHDRRFGAEQQKLIEAIRDGKPDLVVITGDLFNRHNHAACRNAFAFLERMRGVAPMYFIEGNHECSMKETGERYVAKVAEYGVSVLRDAYTDLPQCRLIGLTQHAPKETLSALSAKDRFNLVLAHRPERFPVYAGAGADVILSGHAHGGQIRFGRIGVYAPQQGLLPKYTAGWYASDGTRMFVSRGLGNTIAFPRVFNTPELCVIDFIPDTEQKENQDVCTSC